MLNAIAKIELQGANFRTRQQLPLFCIDGEKNNKSVREMLGQRGIKPEELPPAEDIRKLERRVKSAEKKIASECGKLPGDNPETCIVEDKNYAR